MAASEYADFMKEKIKSFVKPAAETFSDRREDLVYRIVKRMVELQLKLLVPAETASMLADYNHFTRLYDRAINTSQWTFDGIDKAMNENGYRPRSAEQEMFIQIQRDSLVKGLAFAQTNYYAEFKKIKKLLQTNNMDNFLQEVIQLDEELNTKYREAQARLDGYELI